MAVVGLGLDLADVGRIRAILDGSRGERFARRICTERERSVVGRRADPAEGYAARFAAKEAFVKALGVPPGIGWHQIEVVRAGGKPTLWLTGRAADVLKARHVRRLHLSLTHDSGTAGAVVVLED